MIALSFKLTGAKELADAFDRMSSELRTSMMQKALKSGALLLQNRAKQLCPRRTGNLARSIHMDAMSGGAGHARVKVGTNVEYARAVEYGSRAHTIVPKRAKVLAWKSGGKTVFARRVNHPGTRPRPFMRPALDETKGQITAEFRAALMALIRARMK